MRLTKEEFLKEERKFESSVNDIKEDSLQNVELKAEPKEIIQVKNDQGLPKPKLNLGQKLTDEEIKERLYQMIDEIIAQLSIPGKTLDELENTYLMFNGQMSVINRCRLLSFLKNVDIIPIKNG